MDRKVRYPIGQQSFEILRKEGYIYVDKTHFISDLVTQGGQYYFLGRPRRFGKSLFLSTLQCFFEGKRELFKGLAINSLEWRWERYPVLRLDLNADRYAESGILDLVLDDQFRKWEKEYGVTEIAGTHSLRFKNIIEAAHAQTGLPAVILIDEYDKPLVGNLNNKENFEHYRSKLASLYTNFKQSADHIQLVFLTGVTRFSKLSIFSDLNNPNDITFDNAYADICGITERELSDYFGVGISELADNYKKSISQTMTLLKKSYDGYRFAEKGSEVYNPWSLLSAMSKGKIANYWNDTGLPSIIVEMLKNTHVDLEKFFSSRCSLTALKGLDLSSPRPIALLYQTGYLTIKDYVPELEVYTMGIPNDEVAKGLMEHLIPYYSSLDGEDTTFFIGMFSREMEEGDVDGFMTRMKSFFAHTPYDLDMGDERNFHNAVFVLLTLLGLKVDAEVKTSDGRIDLTVRTERYIYIIELKYDGSAEEALRQIQKKEYSLPYIMDPRKLILIGVNYSSEKRRIEDWKIV